MLNFVSFKNTRNDWLLSFKCITLIMIKYTIFNSKYLEAQNLHDYFKYFSYYVWERLKFHQENQGFSVLRETTLNENFFDGLVGLMQNPVNFRLFHAKDERVNGDDFELFIEITPNNFIYFPCQAKKIYPNGEYQAISHPVGKHNPKQQISNLIDYAKGKGLPIYLFFNYSKDDFDCFNHSKELFGCTIIDAFFINDNYFDNEKNKLKTVYFKDLHPPIKPLIAKPLISILDLINSDFPNSLTTIFDTLKVLPIPKYYTEAQLTSDGRFIEANPSENEKKAMFVGGNKMEELWQAEYKTYHSDFLPRYRILLTIKNIEKRKTNLLRKININQNEQHNYSTN